MAEESCRDKIISENYYDFIMEYSDLPENVKDLYKEECIQLMGYKFASLYVEQNAEIRLSVENYYYTSIPKLFSLMNSAPIEDTGAIKIQNQSGLRLDGRGVLVGFIDTGIDYRQKAFRNADGTTRIAGIWDQTDQSGEPPTDLLYGTAWTREQINMALNGELEIGLDTIGHGTHMAGAACGSADPEADFISPAPMADIAMVKLKPAKQYLRDFFLIREDAIAYQENDIMLGVKYLKDLAAIENKPLVIVIGLGTNNGGHTGFTSLEQILTDLSGTVGNAVVIGTGNEGDKGHHYEGYIFEEAGNTLDTNVQYRDVEIRVPDDTRGFTAELWGKAPDIFSVAFISPNGEVVPRIPARIGKTDVINFLFSDTTIYINYRVVEQRSGDELIFIRFLRPISGIWTIRVYGTNLVLGRFDIWLPIEAFSKNTYFLQPTPEVTLTTPASAGMPITTATYDSYRNSIFIDSGRGFARNGNIKPDITSPGVNITVPRMGPASNATMKNREVLKGDFGYTTASGSSMAASIVGGICAQFMQWGIVDKNEPLLRTSDIKTFLIRGASRNRDVAYPNETWGYGTVDIFNSFFILVL